MPDDQEPVRLLSALLQASLTINSSLDQAAVFDAITHAARTLVRSEGACLVLWDSEAARFEPRASTTGRPDACLPNEAAQWIITHNRALAVPDAARHPFGAGSRPDHVGAFAGVPIRRAAHPLAVLYALFHRPRQFDQGELTTLQALADIAAPAVHNVLLVRSLERMSEFKQTMMALLAHDLRNPLTEALGYLSMLADTLDGANPLQQTYAAHIERALTQMWTLSAGVLSHEHAASGQLERRPCDLALILRGVLDDYRPAAAQKSLHLAADWPPEPVTVHGDEPLLRQAVDNLVSNAVKYTPTGGHIAATIRRGATEHAVTVRDDGPGLSPEDRSRLFQPFVRLKSAQGLPGAGLGLSLVKTVVERHGGRILVESAPGQGAAFTIFLPAAPPTSPESR